MKYKVIRAFIDRETSTPFSVGDEYETGKTDRAKMLQAGGWLGGEVSEPDTGTQEASGETPTEEKNPADNPAGNKGPNAGGGRNKK